MTNVEVYQYFHGLGTELHWNCGNNDDVIEGKHFPRYRPFVRGIHWLQMNAPHKGQWHRALMFSLICARINGWENNRCAGDLRRKICIWNSPIKTEMGFRGPFKKWFENKYAHTSCKNAHCSYLKNNDSIKLQVYTCPDSTAVTCPK